MIVVDDVYKRYQTTHGPGKWVLQGVSFTIPPKVSVGLIGANGAGKSTLLRLIGGIDTPSRGNIERHCRVSWPMGFGGGLQGSLSGRQNAKFICRIHSHEDDIPERLAFIQEFAELGDAFDEPVKTYSSGMKSRLQFGISLAFDFDVYISDEVTSTGDAAFRKKAAEAFRNLVGRSSIIMVSHGEGTLKQFCTAGIWLNEGHAYWFDDINDALREYRKGQSTGQLNNLMGGMKPHEGIGKLAKKLDRQIAELATNAASGDNDLRNKLTQQKEILALLRKGMKGTPEKTSHQEGVRIRDAARELGILLLGPWQIAELGYQIKPDASPALIKYFPAPHNKFINLYDLHSQCTSQDTDF